MTLCEGKIIRNDLLYNELLFSAWDGLIVRLDNFRSFLIDSFRFIQANQITDLKRRKKRDFIAQEKSPTFIGDNWTKDAKDRVIWASNKRDWENYIEIYDKLFPSSKDSGTGHPSHRDIDQLIENIKRTFSQVSELRDKVVAHWDSKDIPSITYDEVETNISEGIKLLNEIYFAVFLSSYAFDFGGCAANVEDTAQKFTELITIN